MAVGMLQIYPTLPYFTLLYILGRGEERSVAGWLAGWLGDDGARTEHAPALHCKVRGTRSDWFVRAGDGGVRWTPFAKMGEGDAACCLLRVMDGV